MNSIIEVTTSKTSYVVGEKIKARVKLTDASVSNGQPIIATISVTAPDKTAAILSKPVYIGVDKPYSFEIAVNPTSFRLGAYRIVVECRGERSSAAFLIIRKKPKTEVLTIAFWDLSGFSRLSHTLKARNDLIFDFLMEYYWVEKDVISEHEGVVDKFIGDGVMGIFGLHSPAKDGIRSSLNTIDAAMQFQTLFEKELWPNWKNKIQKDVEERIYDIRLKCGINTGECVVGWVGTDEATATFTALGNTVNIASRMESLAEGRQIIVSERTARIVEDSVAVRKVGTSNLHFEKNPYKGSKFNYYEVLERLG